MRRFRLAAMQVPPWALYVFTAALFLATFVQHSAGSESSAHGIERRGLYIDAWLVSKDPSRCLALSTSGSWLDPPASHRSKTPFSVWQPSGCGPRAYKAKQAVACLQSTKDQGALFVGDSTVRELFWALARKLDPTAAKQQNAQAEKHENITFETAGTTLKFFWDPFLNSTRLADTLTPARFDAKDPEAADASKLIVFGAGLWFARYSQHPVEDYKDAVDSIIKHVPEPVSGFAGKHRPVLIPVLPPFYENLDHEHKSSMRPDHIDSMNAYLPEVAHIHDVDVMLSYLQMVQQLPASAYDAKALHTAPYIWDTQANMLLNLKCNTLQTSYPYDGTCCYEYPFSWAPMISIVVGAILLALVAWIELRKWSGLAVADGVVGSVQQHLPALVPMLIMWAALLYCWVADRTQVFTKVQKLYNGQDFFIFCAGIVVVGITTIRESVTPQRPGQEKRPNVDQPFLSRDQTDEWKGWMQLLILAYHYTGGSKVLDVYKFIRLLVASYLFMTGYGHAAYFYQKNDFSLKRVVGVNFRINLLSMLLPWMMDADYLFYYFAPLVTYWYAVIYLTMRIRSEWNQKLPLMMGKIAIACTLTSFLHTQPWLLDPAFKLVNAVFGSQWNATEWLFRCALDQYIVYIGMIVSILYIRSSKPPAPPAPPQGSLGATTHNQTGRQQQPHLQSTLYFVASGAALLVYLWGSSTRTTKTSSNQLHTYISPLAILAFIHLRNCTRTLRNHYSTAFAWVGKISLETFVLQYHIWLAGDTKILLSTGLFGSGAMSDGSSVMASGMGLARWADCILLGIVFVWVSSKVAAATGGITAVAMKKLF